MVGTPGRPGSPTASRDLAVVEDTLVEVYAKTGRPVTLVGHSRGGMFAKVLAVRHPHRARALVTLGPLLTDPFGVHPGGAAADHVVITM